MNQKYLNIGENSIMVPSTIKIFIKISAKHKQSRIKEIIGILKGAKYSSLELQGKSKEWWEREAKSLLNPNF